MSGDRIHKSSATAEPATSPRSAAITAASDAASVLLPLPSMPMIATWIVKRPGPERTAQARHDRDAKCFVAHGYAWIRQRRQGQVQSDRGQESHLARAIYLDQLT